MKYMPLIGVVLGSMASCDSPTDPRRIVTGVEILTHQLPPLLAGVFPVRAGQELQVHAQVTRADGSVVQDSGVVWRSTRPEFATVDSTGQLRGAATYSVCGNFSGQRPWGCLFYVVATANTKADSVPLYLIPTVQLVIPPEDTLLVGDTARIQAPRGLVDGEDRCAFGLILVSPSEVLQRTAGGPIVAVGPGVGYVTWHGESLCLGTDISTVFRVLPRDPSN